MWVSLKEYFGIVFKSWVFVLSAISLIVALIFGSYRGFEMPFWIWFAISTLVLFVIQFWAFHRVRTDRDELSRQLQTTGETPQIVLPTPVLYINIIDYQFGSPATSGYPAGQHNTLWLRLYIEFNAPMPILVESLELELLEKRISAFEWKSERIIGSQRGYLYFEIPASISSGEHTVQLVASAKGKGWGSRELPIIFPAR